MAAAVIPSQTADRLRDRPGAWVDLGLTLPIFLIYQLAVVFLGVQNATDMVTGTLLHASNGNKTTYLLATFAIGVIFAGVFAILGRGQAFRPRKFLQIAIEGVVYAILMRLVAGLVVGSLFAGPSNIKDESRFVGFVMSLGAGFYEELAFRVILFGLGAKLLTWIFVRQKVDLMGTASAKSSFSFRALGVMAAWAVVCAIVFSAVHYIGPMSDNFQLASFTFRMLLGLALTLIYTTRGFAAAVWTHALYDVWVLVFR
jgi:membrane protease YdiL (CAAX protease family)